MSPETEIFGTNLINKLKERLTSQEFLEGQRQSEKAFCRQRCLPLVTVVLFLLNLVKRPLQDELDEFFKLNRGEEVARPVVSKSAFSQARQKLKAEAFIELNTVQVTHFYATYPYQTWYGKRLVAVDGSTVQLPVTPQIIAHFGLWHGTPVARVSQLFDVLNEVTLDTLISPKAVGERDLAAGHFAHIGSGDLVLTDRGYPAFWLFALIRHQAADFCARMPLGLWGEVDRFLATGLAEQIVELLPGPAATAECQARDLPSGPLKVRLIRVDLDNGQVEVLATSLLDQVQFPLTVFKDLYHHRWPVEENYKTMKYRIEVENWSGKSPLAVYQDFHAKVFTMNLTAILAQPAQTVVAQQSQTKKYSYQVNFSHALSKMKNTVVRLLQQPARAVVAILDQLWQVMTNVIEPIRPDRKYPRKKSIKPKRFAMTYKPLH